MYSINLSSVVIVFASQRVTVSSLTLCLLSWESPDLKKICFDSDIRKGRNLRFCGKTKDCTRQLTSILKR